MEFTEEEVKQKLYELGYKDVPRSKLLEFMNGMKFCLVDTNVWYFIRP